MAPKFYWMKITDPRPPHGQTWAWAIFIPMAAPATAQPATPGTSSALPKRVKPYACASCHLGPDHPDIEIFENSKHGHIYHTDSDDWIWDSAPDTWEPGDYRAPTCATCHMSGIGELNTTHNITERLYWNLWAKRSEVRNSDDVMSPLLGNGEEGRAKMKLVCNSCHSALHTDSFFTQGDRAVELYNVAYYDVAEAWRAELAREGIA